MPDRPWHRYSQTYTYMGLFVGATYAQTATYSVASLLAYVYLKRPKKDPWLIPLVVTVVWFLCSFCTAMDIYTSYYFMIAHRDEVLETLPAPWSLNLLTAIVAPTTTAVRLLYLYRIWRFQQKKGDWNLLLMIDIVLVAAMSLLGISGGIAIAIILSLPQVHPAMSSLGRALEATIAGGICADVLMVVTLCVSLYRARSGLRRTDSAIALFILYTIYNGLLPTCFSFASLVALLSRPGTLLYACFYLQTGNLFLISLVSSLNHRKTIRSRIERELDLNYDAFDSVGDTTSDWTLHHTQRCTPCVESGVSRGSSDATAVSGVGGVEDSFSVFSTEEQGKVARERDAVGSFRFSPGVLGSDDGSHSAC